MEIYKVITAGRFGALVTDGKMLEGIALLRLAIYLERYGLTGYRIECYRLERMPTEKQIRNWKRVKVKLAWMHIATINHVHILFTNQSSVLFGIQDETERMTALETVLLLFCRQRRHPEG